MAQAALVLLTKFPRLAQFMCHEFVTVPGYTGGTQMFRRKPQLAEVLPQLCRERSLFRFELLYKQPRKQVCLSSGELVACYTSDELIESVTYLTISFSYTWRCSCFTLGKIFTFRLGRHSVSFGTTPETMKSCWDWFYPVCSEAPTWVPQQGSHRHCTLPCAWDRSSCFPSPFSSTATPPVGLFHIPVCYDEISSLSDRLLGGTASTYHTWSINLQITVLMILGSHCIFFRAVWLFFIMDICHERNYITFSSTEPNKLPVYHSLQPFLKR